MFVTKRALPRRTFLRGMGATIGLPLLQSMVPAMTATAQTAAAPTRRLGFVYVPHGVILNQWTPASSGSGFELPAILKPLEPFRDSLTIVSNLARPEGALLQDHACTGSWLTGVPPKRTEGSDFLAARSIDQVVADEIGRDTVFPSLEVATEDFGALLGACMAGYSCAYMNTLSWQTPTKPLPMEINPRVVFERMFGWESTKDQRQARLRTDRSVLDVVTADLSDLSRAVGPSDRARLDEYLEHVRGTERRIQQAERRARTELAWCRGARRRAGVVRGSRAAALRPAGARLRDRPDARLHLHAVPRVQRADVSEHRRHRAAPHGLAHAGTRRAHRRAHPRQHLPPAAVRQVPAALAINAGRRRVAPGPLHDHVRQRHGRRQRPRAVAAADGGRRRAARARRAAHRAAGENAAAEPARGRGRQGSAWSCPASASAPGGSLEL